MLSWEAQGEESQAKGLGLLCFCADEEHLADLKKPIEHITPLLCGHHTTLLMPMGNSD